MTDAQRAALKPGDTVLVRAVVKPAHCDPSPAAHDAGDHLRLRIGHTTFWSPAADIVDVEPVTLRAA